MTAPQDLEGFRAPESRARVRLLLDVAAYTERWEALIGAGIRPNGEQIAQLNQPALALQSQAVSIGFGGLAHHIAEYTRLLESSADVPSLRGQLAMVGELGWQARQTLTPAEQALYADPAAAFAAPIAAPPGGGSGALAPPPLITMARPLDPGLIAALNSSAPIPPALFPSPPLLSPSPAVPALLSSRGGPPLAPPAAWSPHVGATPPAPAPPALAQPSPPPGQFAVKNMLGLRAFNKSSAPGEQRRTGQTGGHGSALALPGLPNFGDASGGLKPPSLAAPDALGLPALTADSPRAHASSSQNSDILQRLRPDRSTAASPKRAPSPPPAEPRRAVVRGRARGNSSSPTLWVAVGGGVALLVIALVGFLTLGRRPVRSSAATDGSAAPAASTDAAPTGEAKQDRELPRERLLADNERFTALLAQVHGHGGKESPELRSLLNDQAALASKALSGKCNDGSATCKAWSDVRDLMVGDRTQPLVKRRRGSDTETTRSRWMAGLKMPSIPVEDDPRVLRVFEFYTENPVGRETFQSMLFRCGAYRDLIQSTLIRYDLPPDLMALVFTESGCEPSAKSPVGAAGLWQFMPETGRAYHLRVVEGTIDERYSPFKSTEAGIRMLADLRQKLGSWDLVFASYNLGPFGVLARVERAGGDATFWDLVDAGLLPDETANYSPTVEAIALILANLQRLKFAGIQIRAPQMTADLEVPGGTRLGLVARAAATSVVQLHALNLDFSGDVVPLIPGGSIAVQVPKDVVWQARDSIKELIASKDGADQCVPPTFDWGKQRFTPEMNSACQKRLSAGLAAAATAKP